jgi:DNA-binding NarL/FixJ family response regulator
MGCVRVLLADDQPEMLQEISQLLDGEFSIVAAVEDGEQVVEAVQRLDPDLLVLDISMPVLSGLEAAARLKLKESACRAKLVFVTVHQDPDYVEAAFAVGALGYVLKSRLAVDLLPAIRAALEGRTFVSPPTTPRNPFLGAPALATE